jgi:hypothetical protein
MSRRTAALVLGAMASVLPLAGCGSTSSSSGAGSSATGTAAHPATSQTKAAPSTRTTPRVAPSNGAATAVLPASFTANSDGSLTPSTVAAPVSTTVLLTIASKASHPLRIFLSTGRFLTVPAGGRASLRLPGLKAGRYSIYVEGRIRGALVVGAAPGP